MLSLACQDLLGGATLLGVTTSTTYGGMARFGGLSVGVAGWKYRLRAAATGLEPSEDSGLLDVLAGPGLYSYGLYGYGLYGYGLNSYGLYSYGLYSYGTSAVSFLAGSNSDFVGTKLNTLAGG